MNIVTVKLAVRPHFPGMFAKDEVQTSRDNITAYQQVSGFEYQTSLTGEDAAEEMFDLTNNPSRQQERLRVYGSGRSVSVGDIIVINDSEQWVCCSMGWERL